MKHDESGRDEFPEGSDPIHDFKPGARVLVIAGSYRSASGWNASLSFPRASLGTVRYVDAGNGAWYSRPSVVVDPDPETLPNRFAPQFSIDCKPEALTLVPEVP